MKILRHKFFKVYGVTDPKLEEKRFIFIPLSGGSIGISMSERQSPIQFHGRYPRYPLFGVDLSYSLDETVEQGVLVRRMVDRAMRTLAYGNVEALRNDIQDACACACATVNPPTKKLKDVTLAMKDSADANPEQMLQRILKKAQRHL